MRLFAAVFPPLPVRRDVAATLDGLDALEGIRLTRAENLHFTLAFFGERPASDVRALEGAIRKAARARSPFLARAVGVSGFPATDRARVLYVGLGDGSDQLSALHDSLILALDPELRPDDADRFSAHLTFARPRKGLAHGQFEAIRAEAAPWSWQFAVDALHLVRSETGPGGVRYSVLASAGLGG